MKEFLSQCIEEVERARQLFPHPKHLLHALTEESGEVTKAVLNLYNDKDGATINDVKEELVQLVAMAIRLYEEGDPMLNLPAIKSNQ